jgi:uncharacterized membrane protein YdfJ with MMPL/SSD domain
MLDAMDKYAGKTAEEVEAGGNQQAVAPSATARLAGWSARHAWWILGGWILVLVSAFLLAGNLNVTSEGGVATTDARRASALIEDATGQKPRAVEFVLVEANDGPIDEELFATVVGSIVAEMREIEVVESVSSYQDGAEPLRTPDGRMALIQVNTSLGQMDDLEPAEAVLDIVEEANKNSGLRVTTIGNMSIERLFGAMAEETFQKGEMIGIIAALIIMLAVFGGFALGPLSMFQQMGFGLAVAVILDATIVRMVLVPASMELLGDKNWYFPSWLEWLPNISIEGDSNVAAVDGAAGD